MGAAFVTSFRIENKTAETIYVTPIGTIGREGYKRPLPVKLLPFPAVPAFRAGDFQLLPGENVKIYYDWDDINFSEIMVEDKHGRQFQQVTDQAPTANQYHSPRQEAYAIESLATLEQALPTVAAAALQARRSWIGATVEWAILICPWIAYYFLKRILGRLEKVKLVPAGTADQEPKVTV